MKTESRRAIFAALSANLGLAIAKFTGFIFTRSPSLLAESVHSLADTGNQALLLWGGAAAKRAPSDAHAFGYGRERYFWSFVVALVLFSLGGLFAISHGLEKVAHRETPNDPEWAIGILLVGIVLEGGSFWTAVKQAEPLKGKHSWWHFIRGSKNPELPVVLLEDLGALLGLVIALVGVALSIATSDSRYDAGASVVIGGLLVVIAGVLAFEMKSLLIGESARPGDLAIVRTALDAGDDLREVIHLRTQHIGPDELLVCAKIELDGQLDFESVTHAIDRAEARIRAALPDFTVIIYLEPDVYEAHLASQPTDGNHGSA